MGQEHQVEDHQPLISHSDQYPAGDPEIIIGPEHYEHYIGPEIAEEQFGFTPGKGTTDAILTIRNIIQKVKKKQIEEELWLLFIDYTKAFDTIFHDALWKMLKESPTPYMAGQKSV